MPWKTISLVRARQQLVESVLARRYSLQSLARLRLPCVRSIHRCLRHHHCVRRRPRRARKGPRLPAPGLTPARRPNHVWTVDASLVRRASLPAVEPVLPGPAKKPHASPGAFEHSMTAKISTPFRAARCRPLRQARMPDATILASITQRRGIHLLIFLSNHGMTRIKQSAAWKARAPVCAWRIILDGLFFAI